MMNPFATEIDCHAVYDTAHLQDPVLRQRAEDAKREGVRCQASCAEVGRLRFAEVLQIPGEGYYVSYEGRREVVRARDVPSAIRTFLGEEEPLSSSYIPCEECEGFGWIVR